MSIRCELWVGIRDTKYEMVGKGVNLGLIF